MNIGKENAIGNIRKETNIEVESEHWEKKVNIWEKKVNILGKKVNIRIKGRVFVI